MTAFAALHQQLGAALYQPIEHPDFADCTVTQPCVERFDMIREAMAARLGSLWLPRRMLLDLGCHTGWMSRAFARLGWNVIGMDRSPDWLRAAEVLNVLVVGTPPRYIGVDLADVRTFPRADVVLCLSTAMYLFGEGLDGWRVLRAISEAVPIAFMDFGGMYAERLPVSPDDMGSEVCRHTQFAKQALLGRTALDRPLFMFTR